MWYDSTLDDETNILPWNNKRQSPRELVPHSRRMEISRFKGSFNGYIRTIIKFPSPHFGIGWVTYLMVLTLLFRATKMFKGGQGVSSLSFGTLWVQKKWLPKDPQFHNKSQNYFTGILCTLMQTLQKTLMVDYFATTLQIHHIQNKLLS
jgi:hypothetical protein